MARFEAGLRPRDQDRVDRVVNALQQDGLDALVCTLPSNVLLVSGYWPVTGTAVAVITREGAIGVIAPEDELEFACDSWADLICSFQPASLNAINSLLDAVRPPAHDLGVFMRVPEGATIGFEGGGSFDPASYASTYVYGPALHHLLSGFPGATAVDATGSIARLRSVLTLREVALVRNVCNVAAEAYRKTANDIQRGISEKDIAELLRSGLNDPENERSGGFAWCMSGPNSAQAYAAFQQSRGRKLEAGDTVLLHCNSYSGGFWTDITRTFSMGPHDDQLKSIHDAVLAAGRAALGSIRPGVCASSVDAAARGVLHDRGFGKEFKHATGHGVGFAAINHNALPRIHPCSTEVLQSGMVLNVEPAVYIDRKLGVRQCDVVAVTDSGAELLTPFHNHVAELQLG